MHVTGGKVDRLDYQSPGRSKASSNSHTGRLGERPLRAARLRSRCSRRVSGSLLSSDRDLGVLRHMTSPPRPWVRGCCHTGSAGHGELTCSAYGSHRRCADFWLKASQSTGFIVGNAMTSRIERLSVMSIASRSMPIPSPPIGGMPNASA